MLTAAELHRRGLEASNAGRHAQARQLLTRALDRDAAPDTRARTLLTLAHVESELGSRDIGLARCDQALDLPAVSESVRGLVYSQRGLLLMRAGAGHDAISAFAEAEPRLDGDHEALVRVHLNRGNVHLQQGRAASALADFEVAARLAGTADLPVQRAKAEHNLGYAHLLRGELVTALQLMDKAAHELDHLSPFMRAVGQLDKAEVLLASGMTDDAAESLRQAAQAFGSVKVRQSQAEAELVLARLLVGTDPGEAKRVAERARRRFQSRGSSSWALRAEAVGLSADAESGTWSRLLATRAEELRKELSTSGLTREAAALEVRAAQGLMQIGDLSAARRRLAAARVTTASPFATRLLDREVRAELARRQGRRTVAISHVKAGLDDVHAWQSSFGSLDLQSSLVGHGRRLAMQGLSMALADGRAEVVFEWSERARALASRVAPVRPPADPEAAHDLSDLRQLQVARQGSESSGAASDALLVRVQEVSARIRQRAWYDTGSGRVTEPVELVELQAGLSSSDGVAISYFVGDGELHALVATSDDAQLRRLCPLGEVKTLLGGLQADLDVTAGRLPQPLLAVVRAALRQRLDRMCETLVTPLVDLIGAGPVVVVQTASLAGVPWPMLSPFVGRPLTVPRSATSWLRSRTVKARPTRAGLVAGPRVRRAEEEVASAARAWSSPTVLTGSDARCAPVSQVACQVDVLHVAAHGRHTADNPLFSGLELVDGPWFGYDIDQLESIPSTVILSACELGRSSVRWGEETIGMTDAWLHAGSRCVIAAPASVSDDAACELLAAAHALLAAGALPSQALAGAATQVESPAPAPFLCFGAGW